MRARYRERDWGTTSLGVAATWPPSLCSIAETVLAMGFPTLLLWGPDYAQLYNDACIPLVGARHPSALGTSARASWPEVWPLVEPILARVRRGETVTLDDQPYTLLRRGGQATPEEVYITFTCVPVRGGTGEVGGVLVTGVDRPTQMNGRGAEAEHQRLEAQLHGVLLETALLLDQVRDAYLLMDAGFRVVAVNRSAERALGRSREDLIGRTHSEAFPASGDPEPERQYRRVAVERLEAHFVHHYVGTGYDFHLEIDAYPARDGGVAVFWRDVSERLQLVAAMQVARVEAEARAATLAAVIDSIPDAVLVARADAVTLANRAALDQLRGPAAVKLAGDQAGVVLPLEGLLLDASTGSAVPIAATPIGRAFAGERSHGQFLLQASGSGAVRPVRVAAAPIVGPDGSVLGAVSVLTDMTRLQAASAERERLLAEQVDARYEIERLFRESERLLAESERARADAEAARAEAEAANRTKGEFLAVMSHELRTPLNAIGGYAELIELGIRGPVTPQQREDLARIQKSQRHLLGLINGVLNYARAEAGAVHYNVTDVPLDMVLATCEALVAPQARAKRIALRFAACDETLVARADSEKLQQIVLNLLSNAVKFTNPDGEVTLACAREDGVGAAPTILVRVSDTGRGIAADALERVFEPFVQLDSRLTRTQEGIGLGLAISRDLARGMGGDLAAVSEAGVGSTFTLTLLSA